MDDQRTNRESIGRLGVAVLIGVIAAILFLAFWMGSASEPWSSDPWLMNTAAVVIFGGPFALLALALVLWLRRK
jgi:hypothetical protein